MTNRVVITGQGAFCALGGTADAVVKAMLNGTCAIGQMDFPDVDRLSVQIGAQIKGYDANALFTRSEQALYDPFTQYALIAAKEAMAQSGLTLNDALALQTGVVLGSAGGGLQTQDQNYKTVYEDGKIRVHPFVVPRLMMNAASSQPSFTASSCMSVK